ncbi:MAG: NAD-dependent epimerase/dehydratase family protein [Pseudomonadota bacterium]
MAVEKRAIVTGAAGFTGPYLCAELIRRGYEVNAIVHKSHGALTDVATHAVDLNDADAMQNLLRDVDPTHIFHLAGISFAAHGDLSELYSVNVILAEKLLQAAQKVCGRLEKLVLPSSATVYGAPGEKRCVETDPLQPVDHYGGSKAALECIARGYFSALPIVVIRPFNYAGVGQNDRFLLPKIVGRFAEGARQIELGNLEVTRDFSDVRDVVIDYVDLAEASISGDVVNICSGDGATIATILGHLERISGFSVDVQVNRNFVRARDIPFLVGDPSHLREICGTRERIALPETLTWMYEAMARAIA